METITILGYCAGFLTTLAFLPQVIKVWKTDSTKDISLLMFSMMCTGILLWLYYGILLKEMPIILTNAVTLVLASIILFFKIKHTLEEKKKA
jgi:MtN3 and saliva related transmembrane protein